jgi:hypothetical protein
MALTAPVTEPSKVAPRLGAYAAPCRAALAGTAPSGGCTSLAGATGPSGPTAPARRVLWLQGVPAQQKVPHLMAALQHPEAFLGDPPQLHEVAMERSIQRPALSQKRDGAIFAHRLLQMQAQDVRPVRRRWRRAQPPLPGRHGRFPATRRNRARLQVPPLLIIVIVGARLRRESSSWVRRRDSWPPSAGRQQWREASCWKRMPGPGISQCT